MMRHHVPRRQRERRAASSPPRRPWISRADARDGPCDDERPQPWLGRGDAHKCEQYARWVHAKLLERWPREGREVPLLKLDMYDRQAPFSVPG